MGLWIRRQGDEDVGLRVVEAALTADPLAVAALVIVAVEGKAVAVQTQGVALGVISSFETGEGVLVLGVVARDDGAQCLEVVVEEDQDVIEALTSIADDFADVEAGETAS